MIRRFFQYSLEREKKIAVVLLRGGEMKKTNLRVVGMDGEGFDALLPGRKRAVRYLYDDVLTAAYARGDDGNLDPDDHEIKD